MAVDLPLRETAALLIFFLSLAGLLLLQPPQVKVSELKEMGKLYKVCGALLPTKPLGKGCIYRLMDDSGEVKAVSFFGTCRAGYTCVYGRLDEYRGEKELVVLAID